jgi:threonine dehydrogenase-like Zn-dependent dehydrogenase
VVVLGGGAIGLAAALVTRHFGAQDTRIAETNALRRQSLASGETLAAYDPGSVQGPEDNSIDLVIDAVGAAATRAAASRMVRPGGVIVHVGLLPGQDGLDVRKITLQEVTVMGSYCYTPTDFIHTVQALATQRLGALAWTEQCALSEGAAAFQRIDAGATPAAKIILRPQ